MGEAKKRGSFQERKEQALKAGRKKRDDSRDLYYRGRYQLSEAEAMATAMALMVKGRKRRPVPENDDDDSS